jgi:hypothetical protein
VLNRLTNDPSFPTGIGRTLDPGPYKSYTMFSVAISGFCGKYAALRYPITFSGEGIGWKRDTPWLNLWIELLPIYVGACNPEAPKLLQRTIGRVDRTFSIV